MQAAFVLSEGNWTGRFLLQLLNLPKIRVGSIHIKGVKCWERVLAQQGMTGSDRCQSKGTSRDKAADCLQQPPAACKPLEECLMSSNLLSCSEVSLVTGWFTHYTLALCITQQSELDSATAEQRERAIQAVTDSAKWDRTFGHLNYLLLFGGEKKQQSHHLHRRKELSLALKDISRY